jgi:hypothetical protein
MLSSTMVEEATVKPFGDRCLIIRSSMECKKRLASERGRVSEAASFRQYQVLLALDVTNVGVPTFHPSFSSKW